MANRSHAAAADDPRAVASVGDVNPADAAAAPLISRPASTPRVCGDCTACCTVMAVRELSKAAGQTCGHERHDGCANYADRPSACRQFTCLWLADQAGLLHDRHRPDRVGLVLTGGRVVNGRTMTLAAREVWPHAAEAPEAAQLVEYLGQFMPVDLVKAKPRSAEIHSVTITIEGGPVATQPVG